MMLMMEVEEVVEVEVVVGGDMLRTTGRGDTPGLLKNREYRGLRSVPGNNSPSVVPPSLLSPQHHHQHH